MKIAKNFLQNSHEYVSNYVSNVMMQYDIRVLLHVEVNTRIYRTSHLYTLAEYKYQRLSV
jgi:hypothetical protein